MKITTEQAKKWYLKESENNPLKIRYSEIDYIYFSKFANHCINEYKDVIRELLNTYVLGLDENGDITKPITETMTLLKRAADLISP